MCILNIIQKCKYILFKFKHINKFYIKLWFTFECQTCLNKAFSSACFPRVELVLHLWIMCENSTRVPFHANLRQKEEIWSWLLLAARWSEAEISFLFCVLMIVTFTTNLTWTENTSFSFPFKANIKSCVYCDYCNSAAFKAEIQMHVDTVKN